MAQSSVVDPKIKQEENNFSKLFQAILQKVMIMKNVRESDVAQAISRMKEGFKRYDFPDMKQWENVCAYLFRYATHSAGLTRHRVLEAVKESEDLASCLRKTDLRIVSLGGGPGNDIIGFCSALFECVEKSQSKDKRGNLHITVIDHYIEWSECAALLRNLVKKENFGNVSELFRLNDVNMFFTHVNICARLTTGGSYFDYLQKADVILMVKLIMTLDLKSVDSLMEILKKTIKDEALILYIDGAILSTVTKHFDVLYQSNLENYCMSSEMNERFYSNDYVESKAQIAVLRKSGSSPAKKMRRE